MARDPNTRVARTAQRSATPAANQYPPIATDPTQPGYYAPAHRSVVRHNPLSPDYGTDPNETWGWRDPGGVARRKEYYGPASQAQPHGDPIKPAQFGNGGIPDRSEQIAAQNAGTQKSNAMQQQIDTFARPIGGWGIGFGGGIGYGYPY